MQKIFIGNDHAGPEYVLELISYLEKKGHTVEHVGSFGGESVDYPDYAKKTGEQVIAHEKENAVGIVICGTGIGISIAANKVKGVRCANCVSPYMAEMARKHNDANILAIGARMIDIENAKVIIDTFLEIEFEGERHQRRVDKINKI